MPGVEARDVDEKIAALRDAMEVQTWEPKLVGECYSKLAVRPARASAILFYSQRPDGTLDDYATHGGCPVLDGTKWAANLWVWNKAMPFGSSRFGDKKGDGKNDKNPQSVDVTFSTQLAVNIALRQGNFKRQELDLLVMALRGACLVHVCTVQLHWPRGSGSFRRWAEGQPKVLKADGRQFRHEPFQLIRSLDGSVGTHQDQRFLEVPLLLQKCVQRLRTELHRR